MAKLASTSRQLDQFLSADGGLLDLRAAQQFENSHLEGSCNIPICELESRLFELPKNTCPIKIIVAETSSNAAFEFLTKKNYPISGQIVWNNSVESTLNERGLIARGVNKEILWSPAPIIKKFTDHINHQSNSYLSAEPSVLDIGCGSGRDLVYLGLKGWRMNGIDYLPEALSKLEHLSKRHGLRVNTILMNLEKRIELFESLERKFDLVQVLRYLHRPLLSLLEEKIKPGGYLLYQTFSKGCEAFGKPKNPRFILQPGELADQFSSFDIIMDEIWMLDDGRPTNVFIAQKPFGSDHSANTPIAI